MSKELRKLCVKETIEGVFEKGEILIESEEFEGHFYAEKNIKDSLINIKTVCEYLKFEDYFEVIEVKLIDSV